MLNILIICMITEKLRDEWYTYEEEYDKLNQWIKDTETEMKSDSELKATLEEKNIQLERHNVSVENINYAFLYMYKRLIWIKMNVGKESGEWCISHHFYKLGKLFMICNINQFSISFFKES